MVILFLGERKLTIIFRCKIVTVNWIFGANLSMVNQYFLVILPYFFYLKAMIFSFSAQKIQRRLSTLKAMPWSFEKKKEIEKAVGCMEYTSSDESDWSEDENGESRLSCFLVKKLPWERTCLKNVKQSLDKAYMRGLNQRAKSSHQKGPSPAFYSRSTH